MPCPGRYKKHARSRVALPSGAQTRSLCAAQLVYGKERVRETRKLRERAPNAATELSSSLKELDERPPQQARGLATRESPPRSPTTRPASCPATWTKGLNVDWSPPEAAHKHQPKRLRRASKTLEGGCALAPVRRAENEDSTVDDDRQSLTGLCTKTDATRESFAAKLKAQSCGDLSARRPCLRAQTSSGGKGQGSGSPSQSALSVPRDGIPPLGSDVSVSCSSLASQTSSNITRGTFSNYTIVPKWKGRRKGRPRKLKKHGTVGRTHQRCSNKRSPLGEPRAPRENVRQLEGSDRTKMLSRRPVITLALERVVSQLEVNRGGLRRLLDPVTDEGEVTLYWDEMRQALRDQGLTLQEGELASIIGFLDTRERGYVSLGDLRNGIDKLRGVGRRNANSNGRHAVVSFRAYAQLRQLPGRPDSVAPTHLSGALLTPLVLNTKSPPVCGGKKRRHGSHSSGRDRQTCRDAFVACLDITDEEIASLADYLIASGEEALANDVRDDIDFAKQGENKMGEQGMSASRTLGGAGRRPEALVSAEQMSPRKHRGRLSMRTALGAGIPEESQQDQSTAEGYVDRPLSSVMAALAVAAVKAPAEEGASVRGPSFAAVPSSAARVCLVLGRLQRVWRRQDRRRGTREGEVSRDRENDAISAEDLEVAARLFHVNGSEQILMEDVIAVFREVRVDRHLRKQVPLDAACALAALGRHLWEHEKTVTEFVREAASMMICSKHETGTAAPDYGAGPAAASKIGEDNQAIGGTTWTMVCKPFVSGPATIWQVDALLRREILLSAQQRKALCAGVEENGLVWGAHLARAIRKAHRELAHQRLNHLDQYASGGGADCALRDVSEERDSEMSDRTWAVSGADESLCTQQESVSETTVSGLGMSVAKVSPPSEPCRSKKNAGLGFDQSDASLVLDSFVKDGKSLRGLDAEAAADMWRDLQRQQRGIRAHKAGRSAARAFRQLLRRQVMTPLQWFESVQSDDGLAEHPRVDHRLPVSAILEGINRLAAEQQNRRQCRATQTLSTPDDEEYNPPAVATPAKSANHSDGSIEKELPDTGDDGLVWDAALSSDFRWYLDPCGEGSVTAAGFREAMRNCGRARVDYPDPSQLAAARRFEAALRDAGCNDVCALIRAMVKRGRGGGGLVECVRRIAVDVRRPPHEGEPVPRNGGMSKALVTQHRNIHHTAALRERVRRPENAGALRTLRLVDEFMSRQGRRLDVELHEAGVNASSVVDHARLKQILERLIRAGRSARSDRKRQRCSDDGPHPADEQQRFVRSQDKITRSQASNFLDAVSLEIQKRKLQIRDVFREVDAAKCGRLGVDDLLDNTHRALGLSLKRSDAEALISIFDTNDDRSIECDELEAALRSYRRSWWVPGYPNRKYLFHEEFPNLRSLFHHESDTGGALSGCAPDGCRNASVSRDGVVQALVRLRGRSRKGYPPRGSCASARREGVRARAARKIVRCCMAANVRTSQALATTLARFNVYNADRGLLNSDLMPRADLWHWLRLLSVPASPDNVPAYRPSDTGPEPKSKRRMSTRCASVCGDQGELVAAEDFGGPLLDGQETTLVLDAVEYRKVPSEDDNAPDCPLISVKSFWDFLVGYDPPLLDEEEQARLDADEIVCRRKATKNRRRRAAIAIQGAVRQRKARARVREARNARDAHIKERAKAAITVQCAARQKQARDELQRARAQREDKERRRREQAALNVQCAVRQRQARGVRRYKLELRRKWEEERNAACLDIQCAFRQQQARSARRHKVELRRRWEEKREAACLSIQCAARQRQARGARQHKLEIRRRWEEKRETACLDIQCAVRQRQVAERRAIERDWWKENEFSRTERSGSSAHAYESVVETGSWKRARDARCVKLDLRRRWEEEREASSLSIQCAVRQHQARSARRHKVELRRRWKEKRETACLDIQCAVRQNQARGARRRKLELRRRREEEREAACVDIQCAARQRQARRIRGAKLELHRKREEKRLGACVIIQCAVRQRQARSKLCSKRELCLRLHERRVAASLVIQCAVRQRQARARRADKLSLRQEAARERDTAALSIQCAVRQRQARRTRIDKEEDRRKLIERRVAAAVSIQCAVRQRQARRRREAIERRRDAAISLQCASRQRQARKRVGDKRNRNASATRIQCLVRCRRARHAAGALRAAAAVRTAAEAQWQADLEAVARRVVEAVNTRTSAAITIQCAMRQRVANREALVRHRLHEEKRHEAATKIQRAGLRRLGRRERATRNGAALQIQRAARGWMGRKKAKVAAQAVLETAIATQRAMKAALAGTTARGRDKRGQNWRKKSVVAGRDLRGTAALTLREKVLRGDSRE